MQYKEQAEAKRQMDGWDTAEFIKGTVDDEGDRWEFWCFKKRHQEKRDVYGIVKEFGGTTTYFEWLGGY